jgi:hypothetical protein
MIRRIALALLVSAAAATPILAQTPVLDPAQIQALRDAFANGQRPDVSDPRVQQLIQTFAAQARAGNFDQLRAQARAAISQIQSAAPLPPPDGQVPSPPPADGQGFGPGRLGRGGFGGGRGLGPQVAVVAPVRPAGPPPSPADALVMGRLQGSISAVFNPGAKTASLKLIETDDHGVEGLRTLKPGGVYRDGWRLGSVTATQAALHKGRAVLRVDITRGWPAQAAAIQPAVLIQPVTPNPGPGRGGFGGPAGSGARRGPNGAGTGGRGPNGASPQAAAPGLGLSNARVGGSPPPPPTAQSLQSPNNSTVNIVNNPDGSRTMTTNVGGRTMVMTLPAGG